MTCHDYRDYLKIGYTIKSCLDESTVTECSDTSNFLQCDKPLIKTGPAKFIFDRLHYSKTITIVHPAVFVALYGYTSLKMSDSLLSLFFIQHSNHLWSYQAEEEATGPPVWSEGLHSHHYH